MTETIRFYRFPSPPSSPTPPLKKPRLEDVTFDLDLTPDQMLTLYENREELYEHFRNRAINAELCSNCKEWETGGHDSGSGFGYSCIIRRLEKKVSVSSHRVSGLKRDAVYKFKINPENRKIVTFHCDVPGLEKFLKHKDSFISYLEKNKSITPNIKSYKIDLNLLSEEEQKQLEKWAWSPEP